MLLTKTEKLDVYRIAHRIRTWGERVAKRQGYDDDLCGLCAIAAGKLHKELREAGYPSALAVNSAHCFVILKGYVVDVTATQFDKPKRRVVIRRINSTKRFYWRISYASDSRRDMRRYQLEEGWPAEEAVATPTICGA